MPINKLLLKLLLASLFSLFLNIPALHANTIMVLGDSISAGYGFNPEVGWVALLQQRLQTTGYTEYSVINASTSGNTSSDGLARLPALLATHKPNIIIIELGGNDGLRGFPIKLMQNNLQKMIDLSQESSAKVLLAGIEIPPSYGQRYTDSFRTAFQSIAENNELVFLPFILAKIATNTELMQTDLIHPNQEAQPILLDNVWEYLEPMLE